MLQALTKTITIPLVLVLLLGCALRYVGVGRGLSDWVVPGPTGAVSSRAFYHFHPDEATLIDAALRLESPFSPPLTAYGMLPLYLLRGALLPSGSATAGSLRESTSPADLHEIFSIARGVSATLSAVTVLLTYVLGRLTTSRSSAILSALFVAVAPIAVQQAHFYTVDSAYSLLCLAAMCALLRALRGSALSWHVATGLLVGCAAAVRLNGLLLLVPVAVGYALEDGPRTLGERIGRLTHPPVWTTAISAAATLISLQPYLLADPGLIFEIGSHRDLAGAVQIASGEELQIWTLQDVGTTPYLHHWLHLWPLAVGWPLTLCFALGIACAIWRRTPGRTIILLWCAVYFATIGPLHAKPVRYLLPLLPFLSLLAADTCVRLWELSGNWRPVTRCLAGLLVVYTSFYGLAFARIYAQEDSRIQAARWIAANVPPGQRIGVETGAFSLGPLIDAGTYPQRQLNIGVLFQARGYTTCGAAGVYLDGRLQDVDYLALSEENRYRHVISAPQLLPGTASFYTHLVQEKLGFERVRRFKNYPALAGIRFDDDRAENSFVGFDHPAVLVFRRRPASASEELRRWRQQLSSNPDCPDSLLHASAAAWRNGESARARSYLSQGIRRYPHVPLFRLLEDRFEGVPSDPRSRESLPDRPVPWAVGLSLAELGLPNLAVAELRHLTRAPSADPKNQANGFTIVANHLYRRGFPDESFLVYQMATEIHETRKALNRLAYLSYKAGQYEEACAYWQRSLKADSTQSGIYSNIGQTLARHLRRRDAALFYLREAVRIDPALAEELSGWIDDLTLLDWPNATE